MSDIKIEDIIKGCDAIARINRKHEWTMRLRGFPPYNQQILVSDENVLPQAFVRKAESSGIPVHRVDYVPDDEVWLIGTDLPASGPIKACQMCAENNAPEGDNGDSGDEKTLKNPEKPTKERVD